MVSQNRPNRTQPSPARTFFQLAAASCSGVLGVSGCLPGLAAGLAAGCLPPRPGSGSELGGAEVASLPNGFGSGSGADDGGALAPQSSGVATESGIPEPVVAAPVRGLGDSGDGFGTGGGGGDGGEIGMV